MAELIIGKEQRWKAENERHEHFWMTKYPTSVLVAMVMLLKGVSTLNLGKIRTPVQVIYAPGDKVVSARAIVKTFTAIGTDRKELVPFTRSQDPSQHVLAGDLLSAGSTAEVAALIHAFIN